MALPLSDRENLKQAEAGLVGSTGMTTAPTQTAAYLVVKEAHTLQPACPVTDGGTAGTAVTEMVMYRSRNAGFIKAISLTAPIAVATNGANFLTITVSKRTGAGGAVTLATFTTSATSMVAFVPILLTLTATTANLSILAGDVITVAIAKSGAGVAFAAATAQALVQAEIEQT